MPIAYDLCAFCSDALVVVLASGHWLGTDKPAPTYAMLPPQRTLQVCTVCLHVAQQLGPKNGCLVQLHVSALSI